MGGKYWDNGERESVKGKAGRGQSGDRPSPKHAVIEGYNGIMEKKWKL